MEPITKELAVKDNAIPMQGRPWLSRGMSAWPFRERAKSTGWEALDVCCSELQLRLKWNLPDEWGRVSRRASILIFIARPHSRALFLFQLPQINVQSRVVYRHRLSAFAYLPWTCPPSLVMVLRPTQPHQKSWVLPLST